MSAYKIKTLRDIFELPTAEMMEKCLDEMKLGMVQARHTCDLIQAVAEAQGLPPDQRLIQWPDECTWSDDGKGEITTRIKIDDENSFEVKYTKNDKDTP